MEATSAVPASVPAEQDDDSQFLGLVPLPAAWQARPASSAATRGGTAPRPGARPEVRPSA
ncbi:hypothetical protein K7472_08140 [Streptomyces sp. PTM05]|uniref:PPE-PPW subfamily C-terminal domain-containing protein n=1 Tax=Streptantibioticus parmotrematis TaxID=2873249 RepID=A0ABS7QNT7_9ACTN|nr:hypothetical protein [Streptantibioticus parmotrematis]MBY8884815.1 hypothetical protein [Streptantibioticus parmotrematis]